VRKGGSEGGMEGGSEGGREGGSEGGRDLREGGGKERELPLSAGGPTGPSTDDLPRRS